MNDHSPLVPFHKAVVTLVVPVALLLGGNLQGCGSVTAHQNFLKTMEIDVGRSSLDPYVFRNRAQSLFVDATRLPNGNIEERFRAGRGPTCRVFFEIDEAAEKIVRWRYEGTEADCGIVP